MLLLFVSRCSIVHQHHELARSTSSDAPDNVSFLPVLYGTSYFDGTPRVSNLLLLCFMHVLQAGCWWTFLRQSGAQKVKHSGQFAQPYVLLIVASTFWSVLCSLACCSAAACHLVWSHPRHMPACRCNGQSRSVLPWNELSVKWHTLSSD